ncbi:DNA-binding protein [Campylobacter curvus]|uniref:Helix-turn-helix domain protein n=1 Tax=Campylobacter curvus (strain 525.92) TaxID=360105 RepID=A7H0V5_CAMC5|nr:DNA-binding protein [Campylobacter curvus]EAU00320.1 helix-turn-helix domain protein [Campylobacter curvus 525.92]
MNNGYAICFNEWFLDARIKNELRLLLAISNLCAQEGYCYASNDHFVQLFKEDKITPQTVSEKISKLAKLGYIKIDYKKRGAEILRREIRLIKCLNDDCRKDEPTIKQMPKENITNKEDENSLAHTREENSNQQGYEIIKNKPDNVDENLTDEQRRNLTNQLLDAKNSNDESYVSFTSPRHYASEKDWFEALKLGKDIYDFTIPNLLYLHLVPYLEHKRGRPLKDLEIKRLGTQLKDYVGISQLEIVRRCIKGNFGDIKPFGTDMLRKDNPYMAWELGDNYEI